MVIDSITARALRIPFKTAFVHASASRMATQSIWVTAATENGAVGRGRGMPARIRDQRKRCDGAGVRGLHSGDLRASISDVASMLEWVEFHRSEIDSYPAAWTAVELALLDAIGKEEGRTVEELLDLPQLAGRFNYTAVLGDAVPAAFEAQLGTYVGAGFREFKVKLCGDLLRDQQKAKALLAAGIAGTAVRADANNLWTDADRAVRYVDALGFRFSALEEPLRAGDFEGMRRMAQALDTRIILDESMLRIDQLEEIRADADRWIANVRVSKLGGLLRSLQFCVAARACGVPIIVGAHVGETSVLARAGLVVAGSIRDCVVACEGAFGTHLLQHDAVQPSIMFGRGGILDAGAQRIGTTPGLGLATSVPAQFLNQAGA